MAATLPFAVVTASASGIGLAIIPNAIGGTAQSTATGTIDSTGKYAPTLMIANGAQATGTSGPMWVRITTETSTALATVNDPCIPVNQVRLFANPAPTGKVQVAVIATLTTSFQCFVTPGEGGI